MMMILPEKIIDMHVHIFNLKYIPIFGAIKAYAPFIKDAHAKTAEIVLLIATGKSRFKELEAFKNMSFEDTRKTIDIKMLEEENDVLAENIVDLLDDHEIERLMDEEYFYEAVYDIENDQLDKEIFTEIGGMKSAKQAKALKLFSIKRKLRKLIKKVISGFHFLKWFLFMTRSEKKVYEKMKKSYPSVNTFVFHMLDGYHYFKDSSSAFGNPAYYRIEEQIKRMKKMLDLHTDLIGFLPYNPKRPESLRLIKKYMNHERFIGVKFYPSFGYKPINDPDEEVNRNNKELFRFCIEYDIPILTHCTNEGFQAQPGISGENCNPKYWEELLSIQEFKNLRICMGHAGGVDGWFDDFDPDEGEVFTGSEDEAGNIEYPYAKKMYELCVKFPNVYCEVGFLSHVKNDGKMENYVKRLQYLFENDNETYKFSDKVMYGSDWHILYNHGIQYDYDKEYIGIFNKPVLKEYIENFFYKNAAKFLTMF
ncbi:amidohydrolase family protein [Tenacibaculum sp. 190524A02b]|uniref:amidohydrolase family protein n=1 Tax=Tenacibaculum vairaonense TaxID=3137860 RepID=UPI0032B2CF42